MPGGLRQHGKLIEFQTADELVEWFVPFRASFYVKRKDRILSGLRDRSLQCSNQARFIKLILDGKLTVNSRPIADVEADLTKAKFDRRDSSYSYLMRMPIHSLTKEMYDKLMADVREAEAEVARVEAMDPLVMYTEDLETFIKYAKQTKDGKAASK